MSWRTATLSAMGLAAVVASTAFGTGAASAAAYVQHPGDTDCVFEPGDVPGVDVFFPARCTIVGTSSGVTTIVAKSTLPDGYSLASTYVGEIPCFGGSGRIVATVSGRVSATCHFKS